MSVSFKEEEKQFVFTQTVQQQTLTCNPTDVAWVVVYEKVQHESEVYPLKARKEGGEVTAELPEDWESVNCEFYTFARNQEGTQTSRTSYLQLVIL